MTGIAALQYHPEAFSTNAARLMGRQAAGEGLLKAWVRYSGADPVTCWIKDARLGGEFEAAVRRMGGTAGCATSTPLDTAPLEAAGTLLLAGPDIPAASWLRRRGRQDRWSIVGLTHTTASHIAMDCITDLLVAPVQPWDALICTSHAVRAMVHEIVGAQAEYLRLRLGATTIGLPEMPIIPLGVHPEDFAADAEQRREWRARLGIAEDEVAVLQMGRLSYHAKAHPIPVYQALEAAARASGTAPHLILAGWFSNEGQEAMFRENARRFAPSVRLHVLDGRLPDVRRWVWSAADIFALLVDNVQETFGLAPIEAMAAGLPVVVADWDGYRDTVADRVHGFRIPTLQPAPGQGEAAALRYEAGVDDYDRYVGGLCQSIGFDIGVAAQAFATLLGNADLRRQMGAAGREHILANLSWQRIVEQYRSLFDELAVRRKGAGSSRDDPPRGAPGNPSRRDPFSLFRGYPTLAIDPAMVLRSAPGTDAERLRFLLDAPGSVISPVLLPGAAELAALLDLFRGGAPAGRALGGVPEAQARAARGIGWLLKMGLLVRA